MQSAVGDLPAVAIAPRVWVGSEDFEKARRVVAALEETRRHPKAAPASDWQCAECGETNGPAFEMCWKCRSARALEG